MTSSNPALSLYLQILRSINTFPAGPLRILFINCFILTMSVAYTRGKLRFNARELFEMYRNERDPDQVSKLIEDGREDLKVLSAWKKLDQGLVDELFQPFSVSPRELEQEDKKLKSATLKE
jgi:hypothetical protein